MSTEQKYEGLEPAEPTKPVEEQFDEKDFLLWTSEQRQTFISDCETAAATGLKISRETKQRAQEAEKKVDDALHFLGQQRVKDQVAAVERRQADEKARREKFKTDISSWGYFLTGWGVTWIVYGMMK